MGRRPPAAAVLPFDVHQDHLLLTTPAAASGRSTRVLLPLRADTAAVDVAAGTGAVRVRDLVVRRGRTTVFDGFSLDVSAGCITGVIGPSGCGKTTLLRAVVGVQRTTSGTVEVLGLPAGSPELRRRVAYATQVASLHDDLTVAVNLRHLAALLGAPRDDVDDMLTATDLRAQAQQQVSTLSGGERHRASLAAALLGHPEVLVLDEPTVGLDPELRRDLWALFRHLRDGGATLLVSSHVLDEAMRCDDLVLLRDGRAIAQGTPREVLREAGASDPEEAFLALVAADRARSRSAS